MRTQEGSTYISIRFFEGFKTIFIKGEGNVVQCFLVTIEHPLARKGGHPFLSIRECILLGRGSFS